MKASKLILLMLAGAAAGAVAGLLFAPDEGAETRRKIANKAKKIKDDFADKATEFKEKAMDIKDNIEGAVHDVKKRFSHS